MTPCEDDESWARVFNLSDYGKTANDQFIINTAEIGISKSYNGAYLGVSVYSIDSNFPNSNPVPLGAGGYGLLPNIDSPQVVTLDLVSPIVVPREVDRILVAFHKHEDFYNPNSAEVIVAGTEQDTDVSWYYGCREYYDYVTTNNLKNPVPNANFFINVTGNMVDVSNSGERITLIHNVGDGIKRTRMFSCSYGAYHWARVFNLGEFGISQNEEYVVTSGQVGVSGADGGASLKFNFYRIDDNFPNSFSEENLIGSSQFQRVPPISEYNPQIINIEFEDPIVIKSSVDKILVEVVHDIVWGSGVMFVAGTDNDLDFSWYKGCGMGVNGGDWCNLEFITTDKLSRGNINFYINVSGKANPVSNLSFDMDISNICSEFLKEFSVTNKANVASVIWDFGDPASGVNNTSTDLSPFHDFSVDGTYTITATVTAIDASVHTFTKTIDVSEPPQAYGIENVYACEDTYNSGMSSSFDTSGILEQVLGGQTNKDVQFINSIGMVYDKLPNPYSNTMQGRETITIRVSHSNNPCCYSETTFDFIVNPLQQLESISDLVVCSMATNGFSTFNLQDVQESLIGTANNLQVLFFHEDGEQVQGDLTAVENTVANEEEITVQVHNTDTNCYNETTFKLKVNPLPEAHVLSELVGCDDNDDGISEYFNTSNVETEVLGNQTGLLVTYFKANGEELPNPLPNPYTNATANREEITVRVTNPATSCFSEAVLVLNTSTKPQINVPQSIFSCDLGNGYADFDTSNIESEIIGSQNGLKVLYFDANGNEINNFVSSNFQNTTPWQQAIHVRVENEFNSACYSETSLNLVVNELPSVTLQDSYFLCDLEPFYTLSIEDGFDSYLWEYQDGSQVSTGNVVNLEQAGNYTLTLGKTTNNTYCENSFNVALVRSQLPTITSVEKRELSDKNYIEVFVSGDGDFEYSIDGENFQNSNLFANVLGGVYSISVRDKLGCGADNQTVVLVDYPKFFTPNNDGINDYWNIKGVENFPEATVFIYDRYGKILKQLKTNSIGWDGTFRGEFMQNSDYWFSVKLDENYNFKGHFSLKR
ncbi:hypothetical protein PK35_14115 [Tamlana nanhaiensis]|uniref:PKD domain-containing protein n=2 Tax=Neotamlana nanhaiensis TaxID=1382798 RepID=A0A0D7W188_9FLAO|nr:hypothetical protein PK35_14115 [Tamlana nanhaiensis]